MQNSLRFYLNWLVLLLLPTGTVLAQNLALNKVAMASSTRQAATNAVDSDTNTRWESDFSDSQYIYIDLGSAQKVDRIHLLWETALGKNFQLQVCSANPASEASWTTIVSVTGNTSTDNEYGNLVSNSSGASSSVRYVRMLGTARGTAYGYSLYEFEVYNYTLGPNLASNKLAVASSTQGGFPAQQAFDNDNTTRWGSDYNSSTIPADSNYVYVDLQGIATITRIYLFWEAAYGKDFKLEVSNDAKNWKGITRITGNTARYNDLSISPAATGRYVRMHGLQRGTNYGYSLWEFKVYGTVQPLPVTLTSFSAAPQGTGVAVSWTTASEQRNAGFEVQRSADGAAFATLGAVAGAGTTQHSHAYSYFDAAPLSTTAYYRLKQLDLDGTVAYSPVVAVQAATTSALTISTYPNPTADYATVIWAAPVAGASRCYLTNGLGQVLHTELLSSEATTLRLDLQAYPAGSYVLTLEGAGKVLYRTRVQKTK